MSMAVIGVTGVVVGAGAGIYSASQAGKGGGQSRSTGELGSLPYGAQLENARAYADEQMRLNEANARMALHYGPQFAQQQRTDTAELAKQMLRLYPGFAAAERTQTSKTRAADLGDFRANAAGWKSALTGASEGYGAIGDTVRAGAGTPLLTRLNYDVLTAGPSALRTGLERAALYELALGGALSPEEERAAQQSARSAWSDRGLLYSNPAAVEEVLQRDLASRARRNERRQFAASTQQLGMNEDTTNRNFATQVQGANEASAGNWRNFLLGASQAELNPMLAAGMQRTPTQPMQMLGLYGAGGGGAGQFAQVTGVAPSIYQGVQALTPLYNYGADVYGTNFAAAESRANAQANATAAIGSGLMNTGGSFLRYSARPQTGAGGLY